MTELREMERAVRAAPVSLPVAPKSVLHRAFAILDAFGPDVERMTLSGLARATGLPKSTVHRTVVVLVEWGALDRYGDELGLGVHLFELGARVAPRRLLRDAALPFMEDLYEATHETIQLGVLRGTDVLYVEKLQGHEPGRTPTRPGWRMPAYCTGIGKALLAHGPLEAVLSTLREGLKPRTGSTITSPSVFCDELARIRDDGVAFDREEAVTGIACAAAPVFGAGDRLVAAVSISAPAWRGDPDRFVPLLQRATRGLTARLQTSHPEDVWDR